MRRNEKKFSSLVLEEKYEEGGHNYDAWDTNLVKSENFICIYRDKNDKF